MSRTRFPQSTYRLQFHAGFTFKDAAKIIPYLRDLGITHVYASPIFKARRGSKHGYDVVDPTSLNPELGSETDFNHYVNTLKKHGIEQIIDIVPNHMGVGTNDNPWWNDVLEKGRASRYADFFDIDWESSRSDLRGKVMLPVLGRPFSEVLKSGEIRLSREDGKFFADYYDHRFPIAPETWALIDRAADHTSPAFLDDLLNRQHYRLCYWREAPTGINYRRFFDINDLAALRMERQDVFDAAHELIFRLISEGKVAGLRIDHPDGLLDPEQYFQRLQHKCGVTDPSARPLYVVAEKILALDEPLPENWDVHGTTGYDFIAHVNSLFVDCRQVQIFTDRYSRFVGDDRTFDEVAYEKKRLLLETSFAGDFDTLAGVLIALSEKHETSRKLVPADISKGLKEIIACFPVYRTYVTERGASQQDVHHVGSAISSASRRNPDIALAFFGFVRDMVLLRSPVSFGAEDRNAQRRFVARFQQLTAPVTAKGVEDTAFYVFNRLVSLNEVGGDPGVFGIEAHFIHEWLRHRQKKWPHALSPLSTHDTKRSEDVRARLNVLSEMPGQWWDAVEHWRRLNAAHRQKTTEGEAPSPNDEYLLYQTLLGIAPALSPVDESLVARVQQYMQKAVREAKTRSSWTDPNAAYETAINDFVAAVLSKEKSTAFLDDFQKLHRRVSYLGAINSLSQTLLRITAPGVPDTYQGTETLDLSLVDPDNRRPVNYSSLESTLCQLQQPSSNDRPALLRDLLLNLHDGRAKLFLTWRALNCRREHPGLFTEGEYVPLKFEGPRAGHLFGFLRRFRRQRAITIVPRLLCRIIAGDELPQDDRLWSDTRLIVPQDVMGTAFRDELTGITGSLSSRIVDLLQSFPVALLSSVG